MSEGACRDLASDIFQPSADPLTGRYTYAAGQYADAVTICAGCSVVRECLVDDLKQTKSHFASAGGVRGGVGGLGRRRLIVAMRDVDHPPEKECKDPECEFCEELRRHQTRLDARAGREVTTVHIDANGRGATHGFRSTFARGCRGAMCSAAISTRSIGAVDLAAVWDELLPGLPNGSLCDDDAPQWERDWLKHNALELARQETAAA
jgi:hypothetical protein